MNLDTCDASVPFCQRHRAISILMANDPALLNRFFTANGRSVDIEKQASLRDSYGISAAERTLIQLAISIWTETAIVVFSEVYLHLDEVRYESFLMTLDFLGGAVSHRRCACQDCHRYHFTPPFVREHPLD